MLGPLTYRLQPWQQQALEAWRASTAPDRGPRHGVAEVFTGAGKTILAMACMADALKEMPDLRFAVVVPTRAIARQWQRGLSKGFNLPEKEIGLRMSGKRGTLASQPIVIYVINSARSCLEKETLGRQVMLIVDECHRAGSRENLGIFKAHTVCRLGLSATAGRDDMVDEVGNVIPADEQPQIRAIGPICFRLDIKKARSLGLLPRYEIHHHRLPMAAAEQDKYDALCRDVQDCKNELRRLSVPPEAYRRFAINPPAHATPAQIAAARALQASLFRRKQWLYGVSSRNEVARLILIEAAERFRAAGENLRGLAFNERIDPWQDPDVARDDDAASDGEGDEEEADLDLPDDQEDAEEPIATSGATALWEQLRADAREGTLAIPRGEQGIALYHSRLGLREREHALHDFGQGLTSLLVSVKALIEGLDVPDANIGVSVASTSSGRQRIQTMGRILRAPRDAAGNPLPADEQAKMMPKEIHLLYVGDTVDEEIYIRSNWSDLTGEAENKWWRWEVGEEQPRRTGDPDPPKPPPTEDEAWQMIEGGPLPAPWVGSSRGSLWSYRQGSVFSEIGTEAIAPGQAVKMLEAASARLGDCRGKFVVTRRLHVILKRAAGGDTWFAVGKLPEPLKAKARDESSAVKERKKSASPKPGGEEDRSSPAWATLLVNACREIRRGGEAGQEACERVTGDSECPEPVKHSLRAFGCARPATRPPSKLLSNSLFVECLIALRAGALDRVQPFADELRGRSEPWAATAAAAVTTAVEGVPGATDSETTSDAANEGG